MFRRPVLLSLLIAFAALFAPVRPGASKSLPQTRDLPIEVVQVLELPLNVHEASLTRIERGYFLKLALGNSSELRMIGLRYSLTLIDSQGQLRPLVSRSEGISIPAYGTKTLTFKTPIRH